MPLNPGICGDVHLDGDPINVSTCNQMQDSLTGNVDQQKIQDTWYSIAQQGYATTGKEGKCVDQNAENVFSIEGRIDNRTTLIKELQLPGDADYATMIRIGYERYGMEIFKKISGPFAATILDTRNKSLKLVRDAMALRPLYYQQQNDQVLFGSDVRQILAVNNSRPLISDQKLLELFSPVYLIDEGWSDADATLFQGIRSVPYGSQVDFQRGSNAVKRYWNPPTRLNRHWSSPEECAAEFRSLYLQVMSEHLDTPTGIAAELSGGIDSGCNVSIAGDMLRMSNRDIHAYTAIFGSQSENERQRVQSIYDTYPNVHGSMIHCDDYVHFLENSDFDAYRTTAHPSRQNLPSTFVALAKKAHDDGAGILLSGEGSDWFLEGSDMIWDSLIKNGKIGEFIRSFNVIRGRSGFRRAMRYVFNSALPMMLPGKMGRKAYLHEHYKSTVDNDVPDIFTSAFSKKLQDILRQQINDFFKRKNLESWSQTLEHDLMFPPNHVWQGVPTETEMRLPYLDRRVVEFGLRVPPEYKFRIDEKNLSHYGCRKFLQREAFKNVTPKEVIESQEKETYGSPVCDRLSQGLPEILNTDMLLCEMGVIDRSKFIKIAEKFLSDENNELDPLIPWLDNVLATEKWLRATLTEFPGCRLPKFQS